MDLKRDSKLLSLSLSCSIRLISDSYLIRAEMIAFHEGEVSYKANPRRGAQFYPNCVQIEVTGDGDVELPKDGVSFPGAYKYEDPGVVHNVSLTFLVVSQMLYIAPS